MLQQSEYFIYLLCILVQVCIDMQHYQQVLASDDVNRNNTKVQPVWSHFNVLTHLISLVAFF
jgi:hypothetical protein